MIRLLQRRLIIPRGDTGSFTVPLLSQGNTDNIAVFTIFDELTRTRLFQKIIQCEGDAMNVAFTHNDTVNLKPGKYLWDIKFYQNPQFVDEELVNGDEVDSYYAGFSLPVCEIRETADNYLVSPDAPTAMLTPEQLDIITGAISSLNEAIEKTQSNVEHYPIVRDEVWYTWDAETQDYVSTGTRARGNIGPTGTSISSVVLNDDYTLTLNLTDGSSFTSTSIRGEVGNGIDDIVLNNDYTLSIRYTDGEVYTSPSIRGAVGPAGNGIISITKTNTVDNIDTYNINYTNGTFDSFNVTNGRDSGVTSVAGKSGDVILNSGDIEYDEQEVYNSGTVGKEVEDLKSQITEIDPQFDRFNLYDRANNIVGKYIDNNGNIQSSGTGATIAKVSIENGVTYTICRPTYQQYYSGRMLVVASDGITVLATINLDLCTSVQYGEYVAKQYTVASTGAAYILFNVKLGAGDAINNTIVTAREINGTQDTVLLSLYDCPMVTPVDLETAENRTEVLEKQVGGYNRVHFLINGDKWQVRSAWDDINDIAITGLFHGSSNGGFRMDRWVTIAKSSEQDTYGGTLLAYADDDICPIKLTNSYIGGNHGFAPGGSVLTFSSAHGIIEADIGKTITDANSNTYVILAIQSTTKILVCSTYTGNVDAPISSTAPVSPIVLGGTSMAFSSASSNSQLRPSINHIVQKAVMDGNRPVSASGVYAGKYVDIIEQYDIIDIDAMLTYLANHIGSNTNASYYSDAITGRYCTVSNVWHFTERGAATVYLSVLWHKAMEIEYLGGLQSGAMGGSYLSVPGSTYGTLHNFGDTTTNIAKSAWNSEDHPPRAFYDMADAAMSKTMCIGFHDIGNGADAVRKDAVAKAIQYFGSNHKMYPHFVGAFISTVGQYISGIGFRTPAANPNGGPIVTWYYIDVTPYVMVNIQSAFTGYIDLPSYFVGKTAEIVESDGNASLITSFVGNNGLYVSSTGYGYMKIKLS